MHPLDNVIWQALTTRDAHFAVGTAEARRFVPEVSPLGAFREENDRGYAFLAELIAPRSTVGLFLDQPYQARPGWMYVAGAPLLQMICENGHTPVCDPAQTPAITELGPHDSPEMIELTSLTKPGPFGSRTHEFGAYLGIRQNGKLVAMAGERLKVPGHTEVSAVCTHPEHTGKGYAAILMTEVMKAIRERGEIAFLHVRQDNVRAIEVYRRLGLRERMLRHYAIVRRLEENL